MSQINMTQEEFLDDYFDRSFFKREETLASHLVLLCNCGSDVCHGWSLIRDDPNSVERHLLRWRVREEKNEDC